MNENASAPEIPAIRTKKPGKPGVSQPAKEAPEPMNENASAPEIPAAVAVPAPKPIRDEANEMVSIFNRNPRGGNYQHPVFDDKVVDGRVFRTKVTEWVSEAGTFAQVPRWLADKWKRMFKDVIVDAAGVGAPAGHVPTTKEVSDLRSENAEMAARLKNLEKLVLDLQKSGG